MESLSGNLAVSIGQPEFEVADEQLDDELARVEGELLSLRRRKNIRALVSRLPIEVLAHVFSFLPSSDVLPHDRASRPPPWLAVTHVCQRWRQTALSFPRLWATISTTNRHWSREMLERSKQVPISIIADWTRTPKPVHDAVMIAFSSAGRARVIEIRADMIMRYIEVLFTMPAPLLERLALVDNSHRCYLNGYSNRALFLGQTPNLRELVLYRCQLPWPCSLFQSSIVSLDIERILPRLRPSVEQLREALAAMPKLETLNLGHALPVQPIGATVSSITAAVYPASRLLLSSLKSVKLSAASALDIFGFMVAFIFPPTASITVFCEVMHVSPIATSSVAALLASLHSHFGNVETAEPLLSMSIHDYVPRVGWQFSAGGAMTSALDFSLPDETPRLQTIPFSPRVTVRLFWPHANLSRQQAELFCVGASQLLPLHDARSLLVECDLFNTPNAWINAFSHMKHIEELSVRGRAVLGFVDALGTPMGPSSVLGAAGLAIVPPPKIETPTHLFPRLAGLAIADADLDTIAGAHQHPPAVRMQRALELRHNLQDGMQTPLQKLRIMSCDLTLGHADRLKSMVAEGIQWDGVSTGYSLAAGQGLILDDIGGDDGGDPGSDE
ncbi:hypothetical protein BV25DRAFT_1988853 [Artomyces pyxidatus]|uniref:Uncharacterized protein n=1 Tax=Artomyces pyxidatus TaxID=48021 RepID=A0ACB8TBQ9_9AGAM|nr:hypothetical protein BV25DRAFT_1988853 [Artomyces pyxidatus]